MLAKNFLYPIAIASFSYVSIKKFLSKEYASVLYYFVLKFNPLLQIVIFRRNINGYS